MDYELFPNQLEAVEELSPGKVLCGDTGTGKTLVAVEYYRRKQFPKDVYVITTAAVRDKLSWHEAFGQLGIMQDEVERSRGNVRLVIDSWNNIAKYKDVKDAFFILDEQRLVGSGKWVKAFLELAQNNKWIMLSATPGDIWMDYIPLFVANKFYRNRSAFIERHVVYNPHVKNFPVVLRYNEEVYLEILRKQILVEMPMPRTTVRHDVRVRVDYDRELFMQALKHRWNVYKDQPIKEVAELFSVIRKVVNSDISRLQAMMEVMEKHPRLIVFYNFDYELEALRTLEGTGITVAEWNGHKHEEIPDTERWLYLVQYAAGAEGWNCILTNAEVFYSLPYSYRYYVQAKGRTDRLNTSFKDLYYYIFMSESSIDRAIWTSLGAKKNFNERRLTSHLTPQAA